MTKSYPSFRAAAIQAAPVFLDLERAVEKACSLISEAASNGARLIGFPEAFLPGYPWWVWFSNPTSSIRQFKNLYNNAVDVPGEAVRKISTCCKRNRVYVCISVSESDGGSLYLTQLWFNPHGDLLGKHRKLKPTGAERYIWGEGDGSLMPCFRTEIGNLGGLQCWEHMIPLNIAAMNSLNEQVHVASWPAFTPGDETLSSTLQGEVASRFYAMATQSFVLMASQLYTQEIADRICTDDFQRDALERLVAGGGGRTCIIAPTGKIISNEVSADKEGIAYADIDLERIVYCKYFLDPAGHYSNPSLKMIFNQDCRQPVTRIGSETSQGISFEELHLGGNKSSR